MGPHVHLSSHHLLLNPDFGGLFELEVKQQHTLQRLERTLFHGGIAQIDPLRAPLLAYLPLALICDIVQGDCEG